MKFLSLLLLFIFASCAQLPKKRTDRLSIIQGLTSVKEVEFSVIAPKQSVMRFELRSQEGEVLTPEDVKKVEREFSNWAVYKILFLRDQSRDFNLYVFENEKLLDQRLIGKGQTGPSTLRLAVISCMDDGHTSQFKIWDELSKQRPEYVLMIGDNVYADRSSSGDEIEVTPQTLWERYLDTRQSLPFFFQQKLIPVHGLWDDHDYGINNGGAAFAHKDAAKEVFETFFAQSLSTENFSKGYGVGGLLSLGDFNLFFLDGRFFRSAEANGQHLGKEQYKWLIKSLKEEVQPSFLIKGDQFFGGYHRFESYEGNHPQEFNTFVSDLKALGTPFTFLSGDRHLSEIMQFPRSLFGLPTFEITSSPIHARTYGGEELRNPWRVVQDNRHVNFTMVDNVAKDNHWFLEVQAIGEDGRILYKRELAVYIKDLQNNLNEVRKRRHGRRRSRGRR
jgi:hypothetical protein